MNKLLLFTLQVIVFCFSFNLYAASNAAVAMPDSYSAKVSEQVLKDGGNAVDAAIAAQFVLAVTLPEAGNIGGGGFMTIFKDGNTDFLDYREVAPIKAHRDMYLDKYGEVIPYLSLYGTLSAGVPGTVDGMWKAHQKYGSKSWQYLLAPAIKLAQEGFIVHPALKENINWRIESFERQGHIVNFAKYFSSAQTGKAFIQPELAETLKRISLHGRDGFYQGETAKIISDFMKNNGGIISKEDLAAYQAKWRKPLVKSWRDYTVVTAPPPSSGGIAVLQWLTMYDLVKGEQSLGHNSAQYIHALAEIGKRVFSDRAEYLGDPDFIAVPVASLLNQNYLANRAKEISFQKISNTKHVEPGLEESRDTTHFSIVDKWGNAVSNTTTINYTFGSGVIVEGAGFILNDEMDDFSAKPGVANVFGALGGTANEIQPNKRMLSSMSPTILLKENKVDIVTGSPGGTTIISSVYQSILNSIEFNMTANEAVNAARFHHQLWPKDQIEHYTDIDEAALKSLKDKGYKMVKRDFGDLHMISTVNGEYQAASQQGDGHRGVALVIK